MAALVVLYAAVASAMPASGATSTDDTARLRRLVALAGVLGPADAAAVPTIDGSVPAVGGVSGPLDESAFRPFLLGPGGSVAAVASTPKSAAHKPSTRATPAVKSPPRLAWSWPVPGGSISQGFGCTGVPYEPPFGSCPHYHSGIDIAAPWGTRILAAAAGTVVIAGWVGNGGGYQVWIRHANGLYSGYHHMAGVSVHVGQVVRRGQLIGHVGMTGFATGPHCHFMITLGPYWTGQGTALDPLRYV